jgi:selenide, water dikinase
MSLLTPAGSKHDGRTRIEAVSPSQFEQKNRHMRRSSKEDFTMDMSSPRLTDLAHGGGCGCKLAPAVLQKLLSSQPAAQPFAQLLVGNETADDAAVWQIDDNTCVIATTDFFMPMVDDPYDFGRIAATNAISDVYAMGGKPIMALAILGMPINKLEPEKIARILEGGAAICGQAGIPVAGGHSIDSVEPIYGLAVIGICRPDQVRRNGGTKPGDALILTKGIGIGVYSSAIKKNALPDGCYEEMIASTTLLNKIGTELAASADVHALTDVTGFGILGHGLEMARASELTLRLRLADIPFLSKAAELAQNGYITGASGRNWASYGSAVTLPDGMPEWQRMLLADPQTSGGLLISCASEKADALVRTIREAGYPLANVVGAAEEGAPGIVIED